MWKRILALLAVLMLTFSMFSLTACENEGPMEEAGEQIDEAAEEAADQAEEMADELEESTDQ
ncbi:hypothetical protein [Desulfohalovibrio reitneri]|uniref:hypothetical protein n=1 Tax=Desulfohalovibrio reitneri TaxID=1307759 RepID=UPI0004A6D4BE|nr:hypothetical protein [Desulfohalovibrio reitneri]